MQNGGTDGISELRVTPFLVRSTTNVSPSKHPSLQGRCRLCPHLCVFSAVLVVSIMHRKTANLWHPVTIRAVSTSTIILELHCLTWNVSHQSVVALPLGSPWRRLHAGRVIQASTYGRSRRTNGNHCNIATVRWSLCTVAIYKQRQEEFAQSGKNSSFT